MSDASRRLTPVVRLAPAKLNLTLAVVGRRPDGYHALHSVMVPLALSDRLSVAPAAGTADTLHVAGRDAGPVAGNLVLCAISETRSAVGGGWAGPAGPPPALAARLEKRIPVAAGLGGGSSDAAAAMDAALEAWGAELGDEERLRVAARLGSDVPFFLAGGSALVEGRGELVTALAGLRAGPRAGSTAGPSAAGPRAGSTAGPSAGSSPGSSPGGSVGVLLVTPAIAVSTPDVFAAYAAGIRPSDRGASRAASEHLAAELRAGVTPAGLLTRASVIASANDLLPATLALAPALVGFRRALLRLLGRPVGQSGSGPTCFVLYPSVSEAAAAADAVRGAAHDGRLPPVGDGVPWVEATEIGRRPAASRDGDSATDIGGPTADPKTDGAARRSTTGQEEGTT